MSKKRVNVSIDESVHRQLKARDDINTSGLVNDFLKRYLRGEETSNAAEKLRAERLESEAREMMDEAQSLKNQANEIRNQFEEQRKEKEETWQQAVTALSPTNQLKSRRQEYRPDPDEKAVGYWAEQVGISKTEFCERFPDKMERYDTGSSDGSGRHYQ